MTYFNIYLASFFFCHNNPHILIIGVRVYLVMHMTPVTRRQVLIQTCTIPGSSCCQSAVGGRRSLQDMGLRQ